MEFKKMLVLITYLMNLQIKLSEEQLRTLILERQTLQTYCSSLKSCNDCKNGALQCEWCHDVGCTNFPRLHCPKKYYLDNILKKNSFERFCTEIVNKSPIFVPAGTNRIIKLDLKINDMTLYERNIVCEIRAGNNIIQVKGTLERKTVSCEPTTLNIKENVGLGSVRLIWGGVEPFSNVILMIVYKCHRLARTCKHCQVLSNQFKCGWCKELSTCSIIEECPRHFGPWVDKSFSCDRYAGKVFSFKNHRGNWF